MIYSKAWLVNIQQLISLKITLSLLLNWLIIYHDFLSQHWRITGQHGKGGDHLLFRSTTSTRSWTFKHLFATLLVRWSSHISNCFTWIYKTATRWYLSPYRISIWLIDDVILSLVCLLVELILDLCCSNLIRETGELELTSTITLVLQANQLIKCASHPKIDLIWHPRIDFFITFDIKGSRIIGL